MKTENSGDRMWGTLMLHVYVSWYYCETLKEKMRERGVRDENKTE